MSAMAQICNLNKSTGLCIEPIALIQNIGQMVLHGIHRNAYATFVFLDVSN